MFEGQALERTNHHLVVRVEYPAERGYRMESERLPDWISLSISQEGDSKRLTVHSRLHVNKVVRVGPEYSLRFSDNEIIRDLSSEIKRRFL